MLINILCIVGGAIVGSIIVGWVLLNAIGSIIGEIIFRR